MVSGSNGHFEWPQLALAKKHKLCHPPVSCGVAALACVQWVVASLAGKSSFRRPLVCGRAVLGCPHLKLLQKHVLARCFESKLMALLGKKLLEMFDSMLAVGSSCQALIMSFGNAQLISYTEFVGLWDY